MTLFAEAQVEDLPQLLGWFEAPEKLLPPFLHEATHHWCFNSPVGYALSGLYLRTRRNAGLYVERDGVDVHLPDSIVEDVNRYETAVSFLRPLAEGLALFAEFDTITREKSNVFSTPLDLAAWFFTSPRIAAGIAEHEPELYVAALTQNFLVPMRRSDSMLRRKVSVLGQPLDCRGDAYLTGYLLVRSLWLDSVRRVGRFLNEPDLFLMYLRSFFFDDLGLVAAVLDTTKDEVAGAEAVTLRVQERLKALFEVSAEDVEAYEREVLAFSGPESLPALSRTLRVDEAEQVNGDRRIRELLAWYDREAESEAESFFQVLETQVLARREILYVGSWAATVEAGERFRALDGNEVVLEGVTRQGILTGTEPGHVDVMHWPSRRARVCAVFRGSELVATRSMMPTQVDNDETLVGLLQQRDELGSQLEALDDIVDFVIREQSSTKVALDHVREQTIAVAERVYIPLALAAVPDQQLASSASLLRERGFYPLLDYERRVIEGVAQLGLCCSWAPMRGMVAAQFEERGLDLDETLAACERLEQRVGIGGVREAGNSLLPSL